MILVPIGVYLSLNPSICFSSVSSILLTMFSLGYMGNLMLQRPHNVYQRLGTVGSAASKGYLIVHDFYKMNTVTSARNIHQSAIDGRTELRMQRDEQKCIVLNWKMKIECQLHECSYLYVPAKNKVSARYFQLFDSCQLEQVLYLTNNKIRTFASAFKYNFYFFMLIQW